MNQENIKDKPGKKHRGAKTSEKSLILYNDDIHTFDFVIDSLIEICDHQREQAEQCAVIVHYKGKCAVKSESLSRLNLMCKALCDRGLSARIE